MEHLDPLLAVEHPQDDGFAPSAAIPGGLEGEGVAHHGLGFVNGQEKAFLGGGIRVVGRAANRGGDVVGDRRD